MKESEITALAREYADMLKHLFPDMPEHTYRDKMSQAKNVVNIIMRRYCLVEKSKIQEEYHEANICRTHFERYGAQWGALTAKMAILERFFPDLGKEVEG